MAAEDQKDQAKQEKSKLKKLGSGLADVGAALTGFGPLRALKKRSKKVEEMLSDPDKVSDMKDAIKLTTEQLGKRPTDVSGIGAGDLRMAMKWALRCGKNYAIAQRVREEEKNNKEGKDKDKSAAQEETQGQDVTVTESSPLEDLIERAEADPSVDFDGEVRELAADGNLSEASELAGVSEAAAELDGDGPGPADGLLASSAEHADNLEAVAAQEQEAQVAPEAKAEAESTAKSGPGGPT